MTPTDASQGQRVSIPNEVFARVTGMPGLLILIDRKHLPDPAIGLGQAIDLDDGSRGVVVGSHNDDSVYLHVSRPGAE